jgi:3-dehydrotetronate 4-kinase
MLVRGGMRTVQTIGIPDAPLDTPAQAIVVALKSRTAPRAQAVSESLAALAWLKSLGCRQFYFKYCSTFDSTNDGNIGPVADALMDALGTSFAIVCPAFPENGRTVYRGNLFVGDLPLHESGMQNHPLTPMTDANLVRVLGRQTKSKIGLLRYDTVQRGVDALAAARAALISDGTRLAIADAISDQDLLTLGAACANDALLTGGSGLALGLPGNFARMGLLPAGEDAQRLPVIEGPAIVLSGSCSRATRAQVDDWRQHARPAFRIDPLELAARKEVIDEAVDFATRQASSEPALIYATSAPAEVTAVQRQLGMTASGELVEHALAEIARRLQQAGVKRFVVAGGETSGAVASALGVEALTIGPQIDPGVPWTVSTGGQPIALALKSGNFGTNDFFSKALAMLDAIAEHAR